MPKSLGAELRDALKNVTELIIATESARERKKLTQQQAEIAGRLQVFVDKVVEKTLPEYQAATEAMRDANAEAVKAKRKLDNVAIAIRKFAKAIDKLGDLAAEVA